MHIHILGICGTFMGGIAVIARHQGHTVSGSDQNVYPPMSSQLEEQGIKLKQGYNAKNLDPKPDLVVIGNALSRGNPEVEAVLNRGLSYTSGAQWLAEHAFHGRWVLAVAGTHGKTTTASMLAWVLQHQGLDPGFLIGGIPLNFGISARLGGASYFVIEADEYDTAFFDKRSKFLHYRPRTAVLNNLEFDHADIFENLAAIQRQFHHFVRTIPGEGRIILPVADKHLKEVLALGCWTPTETTDIAGEETGACWRAEPVRADGSVFSVYYQGRFRGSVEWPLCGLHNVSNALSAIAAANHAGVKPEQAVEALASFRSVKRRMEVIGRIKGVTLYDDFAHHPTAIAATLEGLRRRVGGDRIIAVVEPRSNTMRMGVHVETLAASLREADSAILYRPEGLGWDLGRVAQAANNITVYDSLDSIVNQIRMEVREGDHIVFMSNGSFGDIFRRVWHTLK